MVMVSWTAKHIAQSNEQLGRGEGGGWCLLQSQSGGGWWRWLRVAFCENSVLSEQSCRGVYHQPGRAVCLQPVARSAVLRGMCDECGRQHPPPPCAHSAALASLPRPSRPPAQAAARTKVERSTMAAVVSQPTNIALPVHVCLDSVCVWVDESETKQAWEVLMTANNVFVRVCWQRLPEACRCWTMAATTRIASATANQGYGHPPRPIFQRSARTHMHAHARPHTHTTRTHTHIVQYVQRCFDDLESFG
jgi:hypothetical protein